MEPKRIYKKWEEREKGKKGNRRNSERLNLVLIAGLAVETNY